MTTDTDIVCRMRAGQNTFFASSSFRHIRTLIISKTPSLLITPTKFSANKPYTQTDK